MPAVSPPPPVTFHVTDHALARWRERVAEYADAPCSTLLDALRESAPARDGDPLPAGLALLPGQRYRTMRGRPLVVFVTEPRAADFEVVVTVIDTEVRPLPPPKVKPRPAAEDTPSPFGKDAGQFDPPDVRDDHQFMSFPSPADESEWLARQEAQLTADALTVPANSPAGRSYRSQLAWVRARQSVPGLRAAPATGGPDHHAAALRDEYASQTFADPGAERAWLGDRWRELTALVGTMAKSHPDRPAAVAKLTWLTARMTEQRPAYKAWKVRQAADESAQIHQPNGGVNYAAAIKHLLAEAARLSAEVEALKARLPESESE